MVKEWDSAQMVFRCCDDVFFLDVGLHPTPFSYPTCKTCTYTPRMYVYRIEKIPLLFLPSG